MENIAVNNSTISDIISLFNSWYNLAEQECSAHSIPTFNAATLSTSINNIPNSRVVLLKQHSEEGFVFFTNYNSPKSKEMGINPDVSLLFYWPLLAKQIKIQGKVSRTSREVSKEYFASRPHDSQLAAWASNQSEPLSSHQSLMDKYDHYKSEYPDNVPYLEHWGGFLLSPTYFEFWEDVPYRLHKRTVYEFKNDKWIRYYLNP